MFFLLLVTKQGNFGRRGYFPAGLLATKPDMLDEKSGHFLSVFFATRLDILDKNSGHLPHNKIYFFKESDIFQLLAATKPDVSDEKSGYFCETVTS